MTMLLHQLKLTNIRSYLNETIDFPPGTILLSGDIGTGKSTILLAIEFALFGTSRPDLPAESMLRQGSTHAEVELTFSLQEQEITIKRSLKKEKDAIKQTAGYIIIQNQKKELTPVELKAEIISLLGYPEENLSKNKNYIFRYTIYTPQEEMKAILQDNPDIRLDVLRQVFNIDKYKTIRDNLQNYLKQLRTYLVILKTKTEPLEDHTQHLLRLQEEKNQVEQSWEQLQQPLKEIQHQLQQAKLELDALEQHQQKFQQLQLQLQTLQALHQQKQASLQQLKQQYLQLQETIRTLPLPPEYTLDIIKKEIEALELLRKRFFTSKTKIQQQLQQLQQSITESQKNINLLAQQTSPLPEKEALLQELSQEVVQLQQEKLEEKKGQADELLERTSELLVKNETILHHSLEIQQKISTLDLCPTCLQAVSPEHQHKILDEEEQKTQQAQNLLFEMNKKKLLIIEQREKLQEKIQRLFLKENLFLRTQAEVTRLYEKKNELLEKQKQVTRWIQENNQLITQLETILQDEEQQNLDQKLSYYQELQNRWIQKQHLEQQVQDLQIHQQQQQSENDLLLQQAQQKEQELMRYPDKSRDVPEKKIQIASLGEKEKELTVHQAQLAAQKNQLVRQEQELQQVLATLTAERNKFIHLQELHHWLNDYFIPVTVTIEKQVMITIHSLFNQLFQEWFSILMEGENIFSRIDDSFSPIIEQNGYETPFENLSGGEKTSVALAYRLALNRVINDVVHQIKTKDLLILDEPTDGFSSEQLDKVREVLERLHLQQTIIVSHESKIESFVDKVVRIQKEGHVSGVVQ
ncbi:TPA: SMC family ATPase [Candidatus Woesearchaeota archaeon]|nr:SMC family ATPase [Candidatus Woesearchaeota archaeon]